MNIRSNILEEKSVFDARILAVDDSDFALTFIEEIFRHHGFYNIETALNGKEAIEKALKNPPDLVLLDLIMPGMDGFELCSILRREPTLVNCVILIQTVSKDSSHIVRSFNAGASDYITKPLNVEEMLVRTTVHLERRFMMNSLKLYRERLGQELKNARKMQDAILPSTLLLEQVRHDYKLEVCAHFEPCSEVGGDFWGIRRISADKIALYCVDISGHGVGAALNAFRVHILLEQLAGAEAAASYLATLNNALVRVLEPGQFATIFYGVIDTRNGILDYSSAGMVPPLLYSLQDQKVHMLECNGVPLGVVEGSSYDQKSIAWAKGDTLLLYSDALVETYDEKGRCLDAQELAETLQREQGKPAAVLTAILARLESFRGMKPLGDDLTLCVFRAMD